MNQSSTKLTKKEKKPIIKNGLREIEHRKSYINHISNPESKNRSSTSSNPSHHPPAQEFPDLDSSPTRKNIPTLPLGRCRNV